MGISLAHQTQLVLISFIIGAIFAACYDLLRISRIIIETPEIVLLIEDVIYFLICGYLTFMFMVYGNMGEVRWFIAVGELAGAILYRLTIGAVVMKIVIWVINFLRKLIWGIYRWFLRPILRIFRQLFGFLLKPLMPAKNYMQKVSYSAKLNLKRQSHLVYNLLRPHKLGCTRQPDRHIDAGEPGADGQNKRRILRRRLKKGGEPVGGSKEKG